MLEIGRCNGDRSFRSQWGSIHHAGARRPKPPLKNKTDAHKHPSGARQRRFTRRRAAWRCQVALQLVARTNALTWRDSRLRIRAEAAYLKYTRWVANKQVTRHAAQSKVAENSSNAAHNSSADGPIATPRWSALPMDRAGSARRSSSAATPRGGGRSPPYDTAIQASAEFMTPALQVAEQ